MTATATRKRRERVDRGDGTEWLRDSRWPREVHRDPDEPRLVVLRTADVAGAADFAERHWRKRHGDAPMPTGRVEWWRQCSHQVIGGEVSRWRREARRPDFELADSTATRSFPVVVFDPPGSP